MKILVQKFGGTSVASQEARIAVKDKVQKAVRSGFAPVVVVSAMGRKGEPYATDPEFLQRRCHNAGCHDLAAAHHHIQFAHVD